MAEALKAEVSEALEPAETRATHSKPYRRAFWAGWEGQVRGLANGLLAGGILGLVAGALVAPVAIAVLGTIGSLGILGSFGLIAAGFAGTGMAMGAGLMGLNGMISGAAAGVEEQRRQTRTQQQTVQQNISQQQGKSANQAAQETKPKRQWFSLKVALIGLAVGAVFGAGLAFSGGAGALLGLLGVTETALLTGGAINWGLVGLSSAAMAAVGATFGAGCKFFQKTGEFTDKFFDSNKGHVADCGTEKCLDTPKLVPAHISAQAQLTDEERQRLGFRVSETKSFADRMTQTNPALNQLRN